jgi:hypothetical protein
MSELAQALQWAESTMQADSALMAIAVGGVWLSYAPIGTLPPFAIMSQQAANDMLTVNAVRLFTDILLQIKMIGPATTYTATVAGADRIDALFKSVRDVGLSGSGGVLSCFREQIISYSELINGAAWHHLGGLYHIRLQGS